MSSHPLLLKPFFVWSNPVVPSNHYLPGEIHYLRIHLSAFPNYHCVCMDFAGDGCGGSMLGLLELACLKLVPCFNFRLLLTNSFANLNFEELLRVRQGKCTCFCFHVLQVTNWSSLHFLLWLGGHFIPLHQRTEECMEPVRLGLLECWLQWSCN